jgi:hypothetical protein
MVEADPPEDRAPPDGGSRPLVGLVAAGLLVGLVGGLVAAWALRSPVERPGPRLASPPELAPETPEAAEAFMLAWERSRRATYLTITEWHRVTDVGAELRQTRVFAQRPPDRIRSAGASISGVTGGARHVCDELDDGEVECRVIAHELSAADFDAIVDREVELMWRHVEGTRPLYRVSQDGECFHLRLARGMVAPPYGHRTTYCFDTATGAVREFRIERAEGTDEERVLWASTEVTDAELAAIADGTYEPPASATPADD